MKITIGLMVGFLLGAGCRYFDIPSPSPQVLPGAFLVVAVTLGYTAMDRIVRPKTPPAISLPAGAPNVQPPPRR